MIGNFFKRLDSPCESPYVIPCKRGSTPFVSDAVNLMAIGANQDIQEHTADKNYKMNQENNALQQQLAREANELSESQFQRNMNWLREQFVTNLQREDTKYQRAIADMQAAGVNPALAAGGVSSQVSSVGAPSPSNFHVAQTEAAHFDPYHLDFDPLASGIRDSVSSYFQNKKVSAETKNIETDSQTKAIENFTKLQRDIADYFKVLAETDKILADKGVSDETKEYVRQQRENLKQSYELTKAQFEDLALKPSKENKVLDSQADNIDSQTVLNKIDAMFKPAILSTGIRLSQAQIGVAQAQMSDLVQSAILKIKQGELTSAQSISYYLKNGVDGLDFLNELRRYKTHNSNKATRVFYGTLDEIGHTLFSNIRLFGK